MKNGLKQQNYEGFAEEKKIFKLSSVSLFHSTNVYIHPLSAGWTGNGSS